MKLLRWSPLFLSVAALLVGCFGPPQPAQVFGASGKAYTAPALCKALVDCKNAGESACYYTADRQTDLATGQSADTYYRKEIKSKERK